MLNNQELKKAQTFKSLKAAAATPDSVFKFTLRGTTTAIASVPTEIRAFKNLQYLNLSQCPIRILPDWIGEFPNLQTLVLSEMSLAALPASLAQLQNLETLDIGFNLDLKQGFEHIFKLPNLKNLKIDCRDFNLTADLKNLSKLEVLQLNDLQNFEELAFVYDLPNLKTLELVSGENVKLPLGISKLTHLETFTLSVLPLYELPEDFAALPKLKNFSYVGLYTYILINDTSMALKVNINWAQIFDTLSKIKTLQNVDLQQNSQQLYHENLGLLTQIKKLNLNDMVRNAMIDPYPTSFLNLTNLKELTISDRDLEWETIKKLPTILPNLKVVVK